MRKIVLSIMVMAFSLALATTGFAKKAKYKEKKTDIKMVEKKLEFEISKKQNIIEYSPKTFKYLKEIFKLIQKKNGGLLNGFMPRNAKRRSE